MVKTKYCKSCKKHIHSNHHSGSCIHIQICKNYPESKTTNRTAPEIDESNNVSVANKIKREIYQYSSTVESSDLSYDNFTTPFTKTENGKIKNEIVEIRDILARNKNKNYVYDNKLLSKFKQGPHNCFYYCKAVQPQTNNDANRISKSDAECCKKNIKSRLTSDTSVEDERYKNGSQFLIDCLNHISLTSIPSHSVSQHEIYILSSNYSNATDITREMLKDMNLPEITATKAELAHYNKLKNEILEWYDKLPLYPNCKVKMRYDAVVSLLKKLFMLSKKYKIDDELFQNEMRSAIESCLDSLPMWYPGPKIYERPLRSLIVDDILNIIMELRGKFRNTSKMDKSISENKANPDNQFGQVINKWVKHNKNFKLVEKDEVANAIWTKLEFFFNNNVISDHNRAPLLEATYLILNKIITKNQDYSDVQKSTVYAMAEDLTDSLINKKNYLKSNLIISDTLPLSNNNLNKTRCDTLRNGIDNFDSKMLRKIIKREVTRCFENFGFKYDFEIDMVTNMLINSNKSFKSKEVKAEICEMIQIATNCSEDDLILSCVEYLMDKMDSLINRQILHHPKSIISKNIQRYVEPIATGRMEEVSKNRSSPFPGTSKREKHTPVCEGQLLIEIVKNYFSRSETSDTLAKEAYTIKLLSELRKLNLKSTNETIGSTKLRLEPHSVQRFYRELDFIREISNWLNGLPLQHGYNVADNRKRSLFVTRLAKEIYDLKLKNKGNCNVSELIMSKMIELPLLHYHESEIPYLANLLADRIELVSPKKGFLKKTKDTAVCQTSQEIYVGHLNVDTKKEMCIDEASRSAIHRRFVSDIIDWLQYLPTKPLINTRACVARNEHINDLAKYLVFVKCDLKQPLECREKENLVIFVRDWLSKVLLPNEQIDFSVTILHLMHKVQIEINNCTEREDCTSNLQNVVQVKDCSHKIKSRVKAESCCPLLNPFDLLNFRVTKWVNGLGIEGNEEYTKKIKEIIKDKLLQHIKKMNMDPNIFNDEEKYIVLLTQEGDKLLQAAHKYRKLENDKKTLRNNLIPSILQVVKTLQECELGVDYRQQLEETLEEVLPQKINAKEIPEIDILKTTIAEEFIINLCGNNDISEELSMQVKSQIHKAMNFGTLHDKDTEKMHDEIKKELFKIPAPDKAILDEEIELIKTKDIVTKWFDSLPLSSARTSNDDRRLVQVKTNLAKRLHEIERKSSQAGLYMGKEISDTLHKLPLRSGENNINQLTNNLLSRLELTRRYRTDHNFNISENKKKLQNLNKFVEKDLILEPNIFSSNKSKNKDYVTEISEVMTERDIEKKKSEGTSDDGYQAEIYKKKLEDAIEMAILQKIDPEQKAKIELIKSSVAEKYFMDHDKSGTQHAQLHKKKVLDRIIASMKDGTLVNENPDKALNDFEKDMENLGNPDKTNLDFEIEVIKTKDEITLWYDGLPVKPSRGAVEDLQRYKKQYNLSKILQETEMKESLPRDKMHKEICNFLSEIPLERVNEQIIGQLADQLLDRLKTKRGFHTDIPGEGKTPESWELNENKEVKASSLKDESLNQNAKINKERSLVAMQVESYEIARRCIKCGNPRTIIKITPSGNQQISIQNSCTDCPGGVTNVKVDNLKNKSIEKPIPELAKIRTVDKATSKVEDTADKYTSEITETVDKSTSHVEVKIERTRSKIQEINEIPMSPKTETIPVLTEIPMSPKTETLEEMTEIPMSPNTQTIEEKTEIPMSPKTETIEIDETLLGIGDSTLQTTFLYEEPVNYIDVLYQKIEDWFKDIKLTSNTPEENERNCELITRLELRLVFEINELNTDYDAFDNPDKYRKRLDNIIEGVLNSLPPNKYVDNNRESLKRELMSEVIKLRPEIKKERDRYFYKQRLREVIDKEIPETACTDSPENKQKLEMLIQQNIDVFILYNYYQDDEHYNEAVDIELKLFKELKNNDSSIDLKVRQRILFNKMTEVDVPDDASVEEEVKELRIKKIIAVWMKDIPKTADPLDEIHRHRVKDILAKKLAELDRLGYTDENENRMHNKVKKAVAKINPHVNDPDAQADDLIDRIKRMGSPRRQSGKRRSAFGYESQPSKPPAFPVSSGDITVTESEGTKPTESERSKPDAIPYSSEFLSETSQPLDQFESSEKEEPKHANIPMTEDQKFAAAIRDSINIDVIRRSLHKVSSSSCSWSTGTQPWRDRKCKRKSSSSKKLTAGDCKCGNRVSKNRSQTKPKERHTKSRLCLCKNPELVDICMRNPCSYSSIKRKRISKKRKSKAETLNYFLSSSSNVTSNK